MHPKVSICIPVYNPRRDHLGALFESIADQQCESLEVVIGDDASTDLDVATMIGALDPPFELTVRRNPTNVGMAANWNATVRISSGDLVVVAHQDDALGPAMLCRYVPEFAADDRVVLCACAEITLDDLGDPRRNRERVNRRARIYRNEARYVLEQADLIRLCLRNGQAYGEPTAVMFRRSVFDRVGGYDERYEHAADVDFTLRAAAGGTAVYLNEPLVRRRVHAGNLTAAHIANGASGRDRVRLFERFGGATDLDASELARLRVSLVSHAAFDLARAMVARRWTVAREAFATMRRYRHAPLRVYAEHLREIVTGKNIDAR